MMINPFANYNQSPGLNNFRQESTDYMNTFNTSNSAFQPPNRGGQSNTGNVPFSQMFNNFVKRKSTGQGSQALKPDQAPNMF